MVESFFAFTFRLAGRGGDDRRSAKELAREMCEVVGRIKVFNAQLFTRARTPLSKLTSTASSNFCHLVGNARFRNVRPSAKKGVNAISDFWPGKGQEKGHLLTGQGYIRFRPPCEPKVQFSARRYLK